MGLDILLQSQNSEEIKKCHPCDLCDKTLACKASFLNHKVLIHNIEKSFKCDKSGKGFENENVLKKLLIFVQHLQNHTNVICVTRFQFQKELCVIT